jgi:hypothetical protein
MIDENGSNKDPPYHSLSFSQEANEVRTLTDNPVAISIASSRQLTRPLWKVLIAERP